MLTEVARIPVASWDQEQSLLLHPAIAMDGDDIYVADLLMELERPGDPSSEVWHGVSLRYPWSAYFAVDGPVYKTAQAMWLWKDPSALVVAVLSAPLWGAPNSLVLISFDPDHGQPIGVEEISTGLGVFFVGDVIPARPYLEETGSGLHLTWRFDHVEPDPGIDPHMNTFRALRSPGGEWSFSLEHTVNEVFTEHGWHLGDHDVLTDSIGDSVVVLDPEGSESLHPYEYQTLRSTMYRRHPTGLTPVLSIGEAKHEAPGFFGNYTFYDICLYGSNSWWEGNLQDDGWSPAWGSGTLPEAIIPSLPGDGTVVITNPADPDDPWALANLPPGAGLNDWMAFYVDGDWVQVHYGGRVVLVWRMPPSVYQHFLAGGASMGFYNAITKQWQAEPPPGWPPAKPAPLNGWAYRVDSEHTVSETGDRLTRYGTRIDADDVLVFPGDYALVGQALQDDVIQSAPIKHIAGRDLPEVVLSRDDALLVWDAGYGHYLYPVEEAP